MHGSAGDLNTVSCQGQHSKERFERHSAQLAFNVSGQLFGLKNLYPYSFISPCYPYVFHSFYPSLNTVLLFLAILHGISPPTDSTSLCPVVSFSRLLVKYNIYLSLFEFTHPYHWVSSP